MLPAKPQAIRQDPPPPQAWRPENFAESGVAVPFTSPFLAGARARLAQRGLEITVPHPAGVRGVYILPWRGLDEFCTPTLHDMCLAEKLAALPELTPRRLRKAARSLVLEGYAGAPAAAAAQRAAALDTQSLARAQRALLAEMLRHAGQPTPTEGNEGAALRQIAGPLQKTPADLARMLASLAEYEMDLGLLPGNEAAPYRALLEQLSGLGEALAGWARTQPESHQQAANRVIETLDATLVAARQSLSAARASLRDLPALARDWPACQPVTLDRLSHPDWLLHGLDQLCRVWSDRCEPASHLALAEIALTLPCLPREVDGWSAEANSPASLRDHRFAAPGPWRDPPRLVGLIARNEAWRGLAA